MPLINPSKELPAFGRPATRIAQSIQICASPKHFSILDFVVAFVAE
jgi:hypothetical protein